ncbi:MAG: GNAT family N-acetyltransferase [Ktedonobacteraceae bacterium]
MSSVVVQYKKQLATIHYKGLHMNIRLYRETDHDAVWELHVLAIREAGAYLGEGPWDDDLHHIGDMYLQGGTFLVGEVDGQIVAMGAFRKISEERAEIKRMRVHPAYQRRGYGQMILQELEALALAMGYSTLFLDTVTVLLAAQNLYRKNGFRETGETKVHGQFTDIFFEKRLSVPIFDKWERM